MRVDYTQKIDYFKPAQRNRTSSDTVIDEDEEEGIDYSYMPFARCRDCGEYHPSRYTGVPKKLFFNVELLYDISFKSTFKNDDEARKFLIMTAAYTNHQLKHPSLGKITSHFKYYLSIYLSI